MDMTPTALLEALIAWEAAHAQSSLEAKEIRVSDVWPPIQTMTDVLKYLKNCEVFSLANNQIEKIEGLNGMECLTVLNLSHNCVKSLAGLKGVGKTLEELRMDYNLVGTTKGIEDLKKLKVLSFTFNEVRSWTDFQHLGLCPNLVHVNFIGNPLWYRNEQGWRTLALRRLPRLKVLDDRPVDKDEVVCVIPRRPPPPSGYASKLMEYLKKEEKMKYGRLYDCEERKLLVDGETQRLARRRK